MVNIQQEYDTAGKELTLLYQNEIRKKGLVESGKLLKSVKVTVVQNRDGYSIIVSAEDYFTFLDEKYFISRDVRNSNEYKRIQNNLISVNSLKVIEDLRNKLNKK